MGTEKQRPIVVTAAIIQDDKGRYLITRRKADTIVEPGRWEFPGGKIEHCERPEDCLTREIQEELGLVITVGALLTAVSHVYEVPGYPPAHVVILFYLCRYEGGIPKRYGVADFQWTDALGGFDFAAADVPVVDILRCLH